MSGIPRVRHMSTTRAEPGPARYSTHSDIRGLWNVENLPARPTWEQLVAREPRLGEVMATARAARRDTPARYCANEAWFGYGPHRGQGVKPLLDPLVGWHAESRDPLLTTSLAYDVAYRTIYAALPDCRGCDCPYASCVTTDQENTPCPAL